MWAEMGMLHTVLFIFFVIYKIQKKKQCKIDGLANICGLLVNFELTSVRIGGLAKEI